MGVCGIDGVVSFQRWCAQQAPLSIFMQTLIGLAGLGLFTCQSCCDGTLSSTLRDSWEVGVSTPELSSRTPRRSASIIQLLRSVARLQLVLTVFGFAAALLGWAC